MIRRTLVPALLLAGAVCFAQEAVNPFTSKGPAAAQGQAAGPPLVSSYLFGFLAPVQKALNESLAAVTHSLAGGRSPGGLLLVIGVSLLYGVFHAAGPGHGKTIVSSYLLGTDAKIRHAFVVGYFIAGVHALSALAVVLVLTFVIRGVFAVGLSQANRIIQIASFGAVAVIGAVMLVARIRGTGHHHFGHDHDHDNPAETEDGRGARASLVTTAKLLAIAVPAGMIPCPGAVAVILFALSLNLVGVSVLSVASMSVGMGATISLAAVLALLAKKGVVSAVGRGGETRGSLLRRIIEIGGTATLFLIGLVFLLAQL